MSIIKRLQRLEKVWFGLVFDIPSRSVKFALWERVPNTLTELLKVKDVESVGPIPRELKNGVYIWNIKNTDITSIIKDTLPELKIPEDLDVMSLNLVQILKNLEWRSIPNLTLPLSSLASPKLRTPLCVIKGFFKDKPTKIFIPCAGKSFDFDSSFKQWAHYETDIPLSETSPFIVEGYIVDDSDKMAEFFHGKKLSIVTSSTIQGTGVFIRGIDELKKYLVTLVELGIMKSSESKTDKIEIKILESGKSVII